MVKDILKSIGWGLALLCLICSFVLGSIEVGINLLMRINAAEMHSCQTLRLSVEPLVKQYQQTGHSFELLEKIHAQWIAGSDCRVAIPDPAKAFEPFSTEIIRKSNQHTVDSYNAAHAEATIAAGFQMLLSLYLIVTLLKYRSLGSVRIAYLFIFSAPLMAIALSLSTGGFDTVSWQWKHGVWSWIGFVGVIGIFVIYPPLYITSKRLGINLSKALIFKDPDRRNN